MLERSQSLLQYYNNIVSLQDWYSTDRGSHTPLQDEGDELILDLAQTRCEHRDQGEARAQKQIVVNVDREHRDGCVS